MVINMKNQIIFLFAVLVLTVHAVTQTGEYTIKAVFLERFTRFIEWPEELAISDTLKPFDIVVIGENPFGATLDQIYTTQKIRNKKVKIRYISNLQEISSCHLLFISKSKKNNLIKILSYTMKNHILTISDTEDFAEMGVLINFYDAENKIKFEINESAVRDSGLSMSYLLLKYAIIVNPFRGKQ